MGHPGTVVIMNGFPWVGLQYEFIGHQGATSQLRYILCCVTEQFVMAAICSESWDINNIITLQGCFDS